MKNTGLFILIVFSFFFQNCNSNIEEIEKVKIAETVIENCDLLNDNFIVLKQKQGLLSCDTNIVDTVFILFNHSVVATPISKKFFDNFSVSAFTSLSKVDSIGYEKVIGKWTEKKIQNLEVKPLSKILKTQIDTVLYSDWNSFDKIGIKNFLIFSEPVFSKDSLTALQGLQIYTDSLYYLSFYELRKLPDWTIIGEISSQHEIVEMFLELNENDIEVGLIESVFRGYK